MRRAGLALLSTSALAGAAQAAPPAPFNWTGFYIGANVGYGWGRAKIEGDIPGFSQDIGPTTITVPGVGISDKVNLNGWIGGGQVGYNWQTAPTWLLGIEADIQALGATGGGSARNPFDLATTLDGEGASVVGAFSTDYETEIKWFGTVRARTGLIANNLLFYATGGLAYGRVKLTGKNVTSVEVFNNVTQTTVFSDTFSSSFSDSKVKVGYTVGGGIEGQLWDPHWTWKAEYLFLDLGKLNGDIDGHSSALHAKFTDHIVRFGLNFRN